MHEAKLNGDRAVKIWGTGKPRREFVFVDDLADACLFLMKLYNEEEPVNIGSGAALSISDLAETVKKVTGFEGELEFDMVKPDGMPIKVLNSGRLNELGWAVVTPFHTAIERTYNWFKADNNTAVQ
jgi:GDP-L-fucose synthase